MFENYPVVLKSHGMELVRGRVVMFEDGIGCTIVAEDDPNYYVMCVLGPDSPKFKENCPISEKYWADVANDTLEFIKESLSTSMTINTEKIDDIVNKHINREINNSGGNIRDWCAFDS